MSTDQPAAASFHTSTGLRAASVSSSRARGAKAGDASLKTAPHFAPRARLDETLAARKPVLPMNGGAEADVD